MVNLELQVFENYTLQDILGEAPQVSKKLEDELDLETKMLIKNLETKTKNDLQSILSHQIKVKQEITKFSGAQAMNQAKIEMFHIFLDKYIFQIESRLAQS